MAKAKRQWVVNSPLIIPGDRQYGVGETVSLPDDVVASMPAGVVSLKDETRDQKAQREEAERAAREELETLEPQPEQTEYPAE